MIVLSLYFQQVLHYSPLATGLAIAPQGVVGFAAGAFGARLARRVGIRRVLILTSAVATAGFLVLTRLPAGGGYSPLPAVVEAVDHGGRAAASGDRAAMLAAALAAALATVVAWRAGHASRHALRHA
jgi:hypothetical protein